MEKVIETAICTAVPGVMILSTFETISGNQMYKIIFVDARGSAMTLSSCPATMPDAETVMQRSFKALVEERA